MPTSLEARHSPSLRIGGIGGCWVPFVSCRRLSIFPSRNCFIGMLISLCPTTTPSITGADANTESPLWVQKREWPPLNGKSGLPSTADIVSTPHHARKVPKHKVTALQPTRQEQEA